jgi:hypothetical protein
MTPVLTGENAETKGFSIFVEPLLGCSLNYRLTSWLVVNLNIPKIKQFFFFGVLDTDKNLPLASLTSAANYRRRR